MNNIGGDEYHGLAIYDAIKGCKSPTITKVYGHAMSMGAWILQASDKRWMAPNATLMLHYGTTSYEGHTKDFIKFSDENVRLCKLMEDHFLERIREKKPRFTRQELEELIKFDKFLTASEAVELGLADKIM
jgi:ATP-dependent Clp protease protease subunit